MWSRGRKPAPSRTTCSHRATAAGSRRTNARPLGIENRQPAARHADLKIGVVPVINLE